jgi:hypothetical protein
MQNETQNQDTNTQVITQEETPAHNETPQNQDIDPAVTMHPEDLLDPEVAEEPVIEDWGLGRPSEGVPGYAIINPDGSIIEGLDASDFEPIEDWGLGRPSEGDQQYVINPDGSLDPIITDWGLGRPSEGDPQYNINPDGTVTQIIDLAAPSAEDAWDEISSWW